MVHEFQDRRANAQARKNSLSSLMHKRQNSLIAEIKKALEGVVQRIDLYQHLFPSLPPTFNNDDIVILLLGETGSGRTTFIRNFTGRPLPSGSSLECDTQRIEFVPCPCPEFSDRRIVFIDTPGFNHKNRKELGDTRILQLILTWFMAVYKKPPSAVLYFYDMNAARLHCRLEDIARRLPSSPVILTTTMWGDLPDDAVEGANARELGLQKLLQTHMSGAQSNPVTTKRLSSSETFPALSVLFELIQKTNEDWRNDIEADLDGIDNNSEAVARVRKALAKQFKTLDQIRTKITSGGKGYMSLEELRTRYISLKNDTKTEVTLLQQSKVHIPQSVIRVVQRDPNFGVWSKALNSRLSEHDD